MSETKMKIPDGMLEAARLAHMKYEQTDVGVFLTCRIVEAALRWQRDNAPVPTVEQAQQIADIENRGAVNHAVVKLYMVEWVRRMYDTPELEIPPKVAHLIPIKGVSAEGSIQHTKAVIEAFHIGQQTKEDH